MPVAVYRVVAADGATVAECVVGPVRADDARLRAIRHAVRIGGKVFLSDEDGHLSLIFGGRDRASATPAA